MARTLTRKMQGYAKDVAKGETGVQAALNNYDTTDYSTAATISSENMNKPEILSAIADALPDEFLAQVHMEGLSANKGVYRQVNEYAYQKIDEEPDYSVRSKYLDMAYKIKGKYAAEKHLNLNVNTDVLADTIKHDLAKFRN